MSSTDGETPVAALGPLTLEDLALRSEKAYDDHMATYTATEVLHKAFMATPAYDQDVVDIVDAAYLLIREYRVKTKQEWRTASREWATAAGVEIPPELPDTFDDEGEV
ncbi:hypothetical protein [Pseudofrankia sp. BMG5.36]|uniref:hypothetical protein n=1 Tax=Pseudofrankia sp. BMG5.36 TaxID=1834512 RepID=UPI0008D9EC9C|nr:hypothetical protein [Pseudofrankia sp. BMG5.36]OHV56491.1 hypothetical protein BCD48_08495 [Pseudofrankia sp. BMG5.36]